MEKPLDYRGLETLKNETIEVLKKLVKYKVITDYYIEEELLPAIQSLDFNYPKDIKLAIDHMAARSTLEAAYNLPVIVQRQMERYARHNTHYIDQNYYRELRKTCIDFLNIVDKLKAEVPELRNNQSPYNDETPQSGCSIS